MVLFADKLNSFLGLNKSKTEERFYVSREIEDGLKAALPSLGTEKTAKAASENLNQPESQVRRRSENAAFSRLERLSRALQAFVLELKFRIFGYGDSFFIDDFKAGYKAIISKYNAERENLSNELKDCLEVINNGQNVHLTTQEDILKEFTKEIDAFNKTVADSSNPGGIYTELKEAANLRLEKNFKKKKLRLEAMAKVVGYKVTKETLDDGRIVLGAGGSLDKSFVERLNDLSEKEAKAVADLKGQTEEKARLVLGEKKEFKDILTCCNDFQKSNARDLTDCELLRSQRPVDIIVSLDENFKKAFHNQARVFGEKHLNFRDRLVFAELCAKDSEESKLKQINKLNAEIERIESEIKRLEDKNQIKNHGIAGSLKPLVSETRDKVALLRGPLVLNARDHATTQADLSITSLRNAEAGSSLRESFSSAEDSVSSEEAFEAGPSLRESFPSAEDSVSSEETSESPKETEVSNPETHTQPRPFYPYAFKPGSGVQLGLGRYQPQIPEALGRVIVEGDENSAGDSGSTRKDFRLDSEDLK